LRHSPKSASRSFSSSDNRSAAPQPFHSVAINRGFEFGLEKQKIIDGCFRILGQVVQTPIC
jgi:hypothetical protein